MFAPVFYCGFPSLLLKKGSLGAAIFTVSLMFWSYWYTSLGTNTKQSHFSFRQELFAWPWLYEIPSALNCIERLERLSLQKAGWHPEPIIDFDNKLEDLCVPVLMLNINALVIYAALTGTHMPVKIQSRVQKRRLLPRLMPFVLDCCIHFFCQANPIFHSTLTVLC